MNYIEIKLIRLKIIKLYLGIRHQKRAIMDIQTDIMVGICIIIITINKKGNVVEPIFYKKFLFSEKHDSKIFFVETRRKISDQSCESS